MFIAFIMFIRCKIYCAFIQPNFHLHHGQIDRKFEIIVISQEAKEEGKERRDNLRVFVIIFIVVYIVLLFQYRYRQHN